MKVFVICLVLVACASAAIESGQRRGQTGTYHEAGHANAPTRRHENIGGYPGTYHGGQGARPGQYHEAGWANQGQRGHQNIGGYPGTHHIGSGRQGGQIGGTTGTGRLGTTGGQGVGAGRQGYQNQGY